VISRREQPWRSTLFAAADFAGLSTVL